MSFAVLLSALFSVHVAWHNVKWLNEEAERKTEAGRVRQ